MAEGGGDRTAEPFELMQCFYRRSHDPLIRCRIDLASCVDISLLKRAVEMSAAAAPLIFCVFDEDRAVWIRQECDASHVIHLVGADELSCVESALLQSLDYHSGPRLRINVIRGQGEDTLCVIVDHMICDGAGFKEYLYLLAGIYSAIESGFDGRSLVDDYPTRRDFGQVSDTIRFMRKIGIVFSRTKSPSADPAMRLPLRSDSKDARLAQVTINPDDFARMRTYARSHEATVNDLLLTAYARTLYDMTDCPDIVLPCPVDLRRYGKAGQRFGLCNLTSNYFCHLEPHVDEPFDDTLSAVSSQMRAQKADDACLRGPLLFHALARIVSRRRLEAAFFKAAGVPRVSFTNLGIIDGERLTFGTVKSKSVFFATALKRPPSFQLSVSTFQNVCTMTSAVYADKDDFKRVELFLDEVKSELVSACKAE